MKGNNQIQVFFSSVFMSLLPKWKLPASLILFTKTRYSLTVKLGRANMSCLLVVYGGHEATSQLRANRNFWAFCIKRATRKRRF